MTDECDATAAQMSLVYLDLIPGDQVRFSQGGGWRFGVLVGFDRADAVIATRDGHQRRRVPAAGVSPWPPLGRAPGSGPGR